jgi:hypothetical protein
MAEEKMSERTLEGDDVLMIKRTTLKRDYKSTTEGFAGKQYRIYALGAEAFAVHEDDSFNEDFEKGNIKSVKIIVTEDGWSLANHVNWDRAIGQKKHQMVYDSITVENVKPTIGVFEKIG